MEEEIIDFRFDLVRTPMVDELLRENGKWVAAHESSNMTEEEKLEMKMRGEVLEETIEEIQTYQNDMLEMFEKAGGDVSLFYSLNR